MSRMSEYVDAAVGYDESGLPASTTQFTFGRTPFAIAENENIAEVSEITTVVNGDPVVSIRVLDDVAAVEFDFSGDPTVLPEFAEELESYRAQKTHVTDSLNNLMNELAVAEQSNDEEKKDSLLLQMKSFSIPFMLPTILPVNFGGSVQIGFADDPKFIFFTSDQINALPCKVTMIFDMHNIFAQDEVGVYMGDTDAELEAQQQEMWYEQEAKKAEEADYQARYGAAAQQSYEDDEPTDKRLKGVRIK